MKIPTLIALSILILLISTGIWGYYYWEAKINQQKSLLMPSNIELVNISPNSAGIIWQTAHPSFGQVEFGESQNLSNSLSRLSQILRLPLFSPTYKVLDIRDLLGGNPKNTHFVVMKNLEPDKTYFYKIFNNQFSFPENPLSFKTAKNLTTKPSLLNQPVRGTLTDENGNPIANAVVRLKVKNGAPLANFTGQTGNFIITTENLRTENLAKFLEIQNNTLATLTFFYQDKTSEVLIKLNQKSEILPPIIIGKNLDLTNIETTSSAKPNWEAQKINYDLNNDGTINSLDRAIVNQNLGTNPKVPAADLNQDGVVDETDLELIRKAIQ